jgi:hypothetical protein
MANTDMYWSLLKLANTFGKLKAENDLKTCIKKQKNMQRRRLDLRVIVLRILMFLQDLDLSSGILTILHRVQT